MVHALCLKKNKNKLKLHSATQASTDMNTIMGVCICDFLPDSTQV